MGTSEFALPAFQALLNDQRGCFQICLVFSRPDAPAGRGHANRASVISQAARAVGLELVQPVSLAGADHANLMHKLDALQPDIAVVAAFGLLLTEALIAAPRLGTVNIHASLLPRWRGAAPIERAILAGDATTGVSIQQVYRELDSGPIYAKAETEIGDKPYAVLAAELAELGANLLVDCLPSLAAGELTAVQQDPGLSTYAAKLEPNELALDPKFTVTRNLRQVQAASRHAAARALIAGRGVRVTAARPAGERPGVIGESAAQALAGSALLDGNRLLLLAADGWLEAVELVPDGKRPMSGAAFAAGVPALQGGQVAGWQAWG